MLIISQKEAKEKGYLYYFTGKPCKHGHTSERMVKGGVCKECKNTKSSNYRNQNRKKYNEYCRIKKKESYTTEKRREIYKKNIEKEIYQAAKTRAKNNNLPFTITLKDVIIPDICPVFGIKLNTGDRLNSPTLDRIDNKLGYVDGNVKIISSKANRLKNNGTLEEFKQIIEYLEKNIKK